MFKKMEFPHVLKHLESGPLEQPASNGTCQCLSHQGLSCARRAREQNASRNLGANLKATGQPQIGKTGILKLNSVTVRYNFRCLKSHLDDVDICFYIPSSALLCAEKANNLQLLTLGL